MLTASDAAAFERCIRDGGVALFPADTVYGLAVDPESSAAVERLYRLKGRPATRPAAVMFFALERLIAALPELPPRTRAAAERLMPGPVTLVVANPNRRFPLACGPAPERLGVRVPALTGALSPIREVGIPVLQSSANLSAGPDAARIADVDAAVRDGVDVALDGGELPGTASTVVDLSDYDATGEVQILREGAVPAATVQQALG